MWQTSGLQTVRLADVYAALGKTISSLVRLVQLASKYKLYYLLYSYFGH